MSEIQKGPEYYANWRAGRSERPPVPPSASNRTERLQPTVNKEAQQGRIQEQIRGIQSRIQQEQMAVERMKGDGLSWQAEQKEATIKTLESQMRLLRNDIDKLAA